MLSSQVELGSWGGGDSWHGGHLCQPRPVAHCSLTHILATCIASHVSSPCLLHPILLICSLLRNRPTSPIPCGEASGCPQALRMAEEAGGGGGLRSGDPWCPCHSGALREDVRCSSLLLFHILLLRGVADGGPVLGETVRMSASLGPVAA